MLTVHIFNRLQGARSAGRRGEVSTVISKRLRTSLNPVPRVVPNMQRSKQASDIISLWSKAENEARRQRAELLQLSRYWMHGVRAGTRGFFLRNLFPSMQHP